MTLTFLILLAAVFAALQFMSVKKGCRGLTCSRRPDTPLVETGEPFRLVSRVVNTRRLPILFVRLSEPVPYTLCVEGENPPVREQTVLGTLATRSVERTLFLMPHETWEGTLTVSVPARGRYVFTSSNLTAGDFLGLRENTKTFSYLEEAVALPERAAVPGLDGAFGNFLGDVSVRRFILSDPVLTAGYHEYTGREPMKDVSWPRTLQSGTLMVKEYDHTAELSVMVLLNIDGASQEAAEKCFSVTRSALEDLTKRGVSFSFCSNAHTGSRAGLWEYLEDGTGRVHLYTALEGLGRAPLPGLRCPFKTLLQEAQTRNSRSKGYVLITPPLSPSEKRLIEAVKSRTSLPVLVIPVTEEGACC